MRKILHMFFGGAWEKLSTRKWHGKKYKSHVGKERQHFHFKIIYFHFPRASIKLLHNVHSMKRRENIKKQPRRKKIDYQNICSNVVTIFV